MGKKRNLFFNSLRFLEAVFYLLLQLSNLLGRLVIKGPPHPLHLVLVDLVNVSNTLEDICYVIDTSLLNTQLLRCLVYVKHKVLLTLNEIHKPFSQQG